MTKSFKLAIFAAVLISALFIGLLADRQGFFNVAQAKIGFTIFPAKLSLEVDKGSEYNGLIKLTNDGDDKTMVLADVQDILPTSGSSGYSYLPKAPGITTLVDWVQISRKPFELKPRQTKEVPFTIKVPSDASAGSRFAVIFFATGFLGGGGQLNVSARTGTVVLLTVPGDFRQTGEVLNFRASKFIYNRKSINFKFDFSNTGTVYFEPKGTIAITNIFGKKLANIEVAGNVVLPTGLRTLEAIWPAPGYLLGIYKAHLAINVTGKGDIATKDVVFYALPLYPSLGALGVLIILILLFWYIKKNFQFSIVKKESESTQNPKNKF